MATLLSKILFLPRCAATCPLEYYKKSYYILAAPLCTAATLNRNPSPATETSTLDEPVAGGEHSKKSTDDSAITASSSLYKQSSTALKISPSADARIMLEKIETDETAVTKHTKQELLAAIEQGLEPVVPFRFWKIAMKRTHIPAKNYDPLLPRERKIYVAHMTAVRQRKLSYKDPATKKQVRTVSALLLLEKCCGQMCRHCPYEFENVPAELKHKKVFNGAYYT